MAALADPRIAPRPERHREILRVLWTVLVLNWTVALLKVLLGYKIHSSAIFADGLHSFSDGASNVIGLVGISLARHPADFDHHYGHQKYETFASSIIAFLLFAVSFGIYRDAISAFMEDRSPRVTGASFAIMGATLVVNLFVAWYERRKADELKSELLRADAWHTASDVFVTVSVLAGLAGLRLGFPKIDAILAFVIATIIVTIALRLLKTSSDVLLDKAPIQTEAIDAIVRRVEGVRDCHEIRARGRKEEAYVDLHVVVDDGMTVQAAHRLSNIIEREIRREIPGVNDVIVHIEPVSHDHEDI